MLSICNMTYVCLMTGRTEPMEKKVFLIVESENWRNVIICIFGYFFIYDNLRLKNVHTIITFVNFIAIRKMQEIPLEHITRFQIVNNGYKLEFSAVDDELTWLHKHVRLSHFLAE